MNSSFVNMANLIYILTLLFLLKHMQTSFGGLEHTVEQERDYPYKMKT